MEQEEKKQKRLKKLLEVAVKGEEAILDSIFEIEDKLEEIELKSTPEKGDKGDSYELTDEDKKEIASLIKVPIVEKVIEKVIEKTEVVKEQPIINEVTKITNEVKEVAKSDTAEQIVEKINSTEKSIDFKTLKNYPDYSEEIKRLKTAINSTPAITTSFINGTRAKNINFSDLNVFYKDDTAYVDYSNTYLKLDQTTPQTISNGIPLLNVSLTDFTNEKQIVNKEYVDNAINFISDYYFNNTADAIGGIYYQMTDVDLAQGASTLTTGSLTSGDDQPVFNFITEDALGVNKLNSGVYKVHIHALKTGTRSVNLYIKLYVRTSGGTETLVATSTDTVELGLTDGEYDLSASVATPVTINSTDKFIVKFFANVGASGSNVTISLNLEDDYNSRVSIPVESDVLNQIFIRQDGTKALTANWNAGAFDITADNFITNDATASRIASFGASKQLVALDTATYPSLTELSYVKGVTSAIQTQIDGKQPLDATLTSLASISGVTGDLIYASGTDTWTRLAGVATGNALISGGVLTAPSWGKIGLTTHISGTLAVGNGGTGSTSFTTGSIPFSNGTILTENNSNFFWDNTNIQLKIGSTSSANATTTNPLTVTKTSTSYVAVHIQNLSSGTAASTDLIVANNADDGTVATGTYLDLGINSSGYTGSGILNGAGDAYLYNNLEDLIIATGTAGKNVIIGTGGFGGTAASKTRATFTDTGLQMMNGTAANPSISFTGSTTTGFYQSATSTLGVSIAGTSRATWGASTLSINSSDGGTLDLGGTSQYMDFGGTITPSANTFQTVRTATTWTPAVNRTSGFAFNNQFILGGTTTGLTLTTAVGNRSAILTAVGSSIGIAITNAYDFEARDFNNNSSGTVTVTTLVGYFCNNLTFGTNNYGFQGAVSSGSNKYNLYMSGTAQNYLEGNLSVGISTASAKLHVVQTGTTTPVQQLSSTATNDDPTEITLQSRVATTNATVTTLATIATTTGYSYLVISRIIGRRTGGTSGVAGDYATYEVRASANNEGGVLNIDAVTTTTVFEDQAGWDATIDASGTDIRIRVTGAANNNITWHATTMYYLMST